MGKAQRYTMEQIQAAQKSLRGLAVKNAGKTRAETVEFLAADIRKAVEQGYSLNEIRDTLAKAHERSAWARRGWKRRKRSGICRKFRASLNRKAWSRLRLILP